MPWAPAAGGRQGGGDGTVGPSRCHLGQPRCHRSPCAPGLCSSLFLFLFFIAFISSFCPHWGVRSQLSGEGVWGNEPTPSSSAGCVALGLVLGFFCSWGNGSGCSWQHPDRKSCAPGGMEDICLPIAQL